VARLYEDWDWWAGRSVRDVEAVLDGTDVAVGLRDDGDLVAAAARSPAGSTTRKATTHRRGRPPRRGAWPTGRETLRDYHALADVDHVELLCEEQRVPFYESCGFEPNRDFVEMVYE